jgi:hypothetical protein
MKYDSYARFLKSNIYKDCLNEKKLWDWDAKVELFSQNQQLIREHNFPENFIDCNSTREFYDEKIERSTDYSEKGIIRIQKFNYRKPSVVGPGSRN